MSEPKDKFTPGPWPIRRTPHYVEVAIGEDGNIFHQTLYAGGDPNDEDAETDAEVIANAHLISASTDLLAACRMVLDRWTFDGHQEHTHTWHDWADCKAVIDAAISKATGQDQP